MISFSIKNKYKKMTEDERDNLLRYRRNNRIEKLKDKELNIK